MKKFFAILLAGVLTVGLAACGGSDDAATNDDSNKEEITLKIGASPTPHAEILNAAKDELAEKGIKLDIVEFTDYVQPNLATESGDLDANYFQHTPYLEQFNKEQGTHLVAVGKVHFEPMSIYAGTVKDLKDIPAGTKVGIPNDATNGGRALLLLEANGLTFTDAVKTTCFLADMGDFAAFNEVYGKYFTGKPARSCVAVKTLPKNVLCEVEVIAEMK